ncbi:MAG: hypothetical protein CM15mP125_0800 [Gammaproteobacteria bacterium]|nr:MAG: hypothetical protein CM15mP125_0800 [Gammaproteobacteria bacterium]
MRMEQLDCGAARRSREKGVGAPSRETIKQRMRWLMLDEEDVQMRSSRCDSKSTSSLEGPK